MDFEVSAKMSIWERLESLPNEALQQVQQIYGEHFPIEVRCALSKWIEEQPWEDLDQDNPQHENYVRTLVQSLVKELHAKSESNDMNFVTKLKLGQAANYFAENYGHNPFILVGIIKQCMQQELRIIQQVENQVLMPLDGGVLQPLTPADLLTPRFAAVTRSTQECDDELRKMQEAQEQFTIQYQELNKRIQILQQLQQQGPQNGQQALYDQTIARYQKEQVTMDQALRERIRALIQLRAKWLEKHQDNFNSIKALQSAVLEDELIKWKRGQQLNGNGGVFDNNIEKIQEWCESLAELIWAHRSQLKKVEFIIGNLNLQDNCADRVTLLHKQITDLLSSLVTNTFIIEKQPPQVMKTNTRFTSTIRLLVGGKLNVHMSPPQVKVSIISEAQANSLLRREEQRSMGDSSGDILNNTGQMEYHAATRQLSVNFRNMQLRKIKRAEKKGTESVMDEKFSLLFTSQFKVAGGDFMFSVWTLSLPVVVIVHGNQEPHAWATVTWDNAFAEPGRAPFAVPDKVPWCRVGEVLSMKFKSYVGRDLPKESLHFLGGKAFRNPNLPDYDNLLLTWAQFSKEPLQNHNFTFWEWFYQILKVTREHLRGLWNDGTVMGFVGKKQAEEMLLQRPTGTFLLRYSDSELGGVTIAWVTDDGTGHREVFMLQPFTSRDFAIRALADRINDLKHLTYLYPEIPKDLAFSKYYAPASENQPQPNGYVKPMLVVQIPGLSNFSMDSYPNTPQSVIHNPGSPSDSISYHDNPGSVRSVNIDQMTSMGSTDYNQMDDLFNADSLDLSGIPDMDLSNINMDMLMSSMGASGLTGSFSGVKPMD